MSKCKLYFELSHQFSTDGMVQTYKLLKWYLHIFSVVGVTCELLTLPPVLWIVHSMSTPHWSLRSVVAFGWEVKLLLKLGKEALLPSVQAIRISMTGIIENLRRHIAFKKSMLIISKYLLIYVSKKLPNHGYPFEIQLLHH